jgi:putative thioredoxin
MTDVTDSDFATQVIERSSQVPVVVDLWAPWCGPCKQLGPIIEKVVAATEGKVELAKVNVDDNPQVAQMFQVQGIPAVYAVKNGAVVDGFVGAQGEQAVAEFVQRLIDAQEPSEIDLLVEAGDEASLRRALELDADHEAAVVALAQMLVERGDSDEALALLARIPEDGETRRIAALARTGGVVADDADVKLNALLESVKEDESARQEFLDLLELLGPDDPRTAEYRKQLSLRLY